jgi:hypothetical protein
MNYVRIYENLVERGRNVNKIHGIHETHHILPKSLGGTDDKANLTTLTFKEHIFAHKLLVLITKGDERIKMLYAINMILRRKGTRLSPNEAAIARKALVEAATGNQNAKGVVFTEERKKYLIGNSYAKSLKGYKQTPEHVKKRTERRKGHKDTPTRPVKCLDDDKVFRSSVDAAHYYGLHATSIRAVCLGKRKTTGKRRFVYL